MSANTIQLLTDQHQRVRITARTRIQCRAGLAWVSRAGDAQDYFLRAGESLVLECSPAVVVGALQAATVQLLPCREELCERVGLVEKRELRAAPAGGPDLSGLRPSRSAR